MLSKCNTINTKRQFSFPPKRYYSVQKWARKVTSWLHGWSSRKRRRYGYPLGNTVISPSDKFCTCGSPCLVLHCRHFCVAWILLPCWYSRYVPTGCSPTYLPLQSCWRAAATFGHAGEPAWGSASWNCMQLLLYGDLAGPEVAIAFTFLKVCKKHIYIHTHVYLILCTEGLQVAIFHLWKGKVIFKNIQLQYYLSLLYTLYYYYFYMLFFFPMKSGVVL